MITMGALLAAENPGSEDFAETLASAVLALLAVWVAHTYAAMIAHRLGQPERPPTAGTAAAGSGSHEPDAGESSPDEVTSKPVTGVAAAWDPPKARWRSLVGGEFAVLKGGVLPLTALILSWVAGASLSTAIWATLATCAGTLVATELLVGLRAAGGPLTLTLQVLAGASLGVAVLALEVILHH
jgi:hypothetical protein